jgi:hypothetical protein
MSRTEGLEKDCLMCSPRSMERKVSRSGKTFLLLGQSCSGINCGMCGGFCCLKCLKKILSVFPKDRRATDHWYMYVTEWVTDREDTRDTPVLYPAGPFVGHCCELRVLSKVPFENTTTATRFDGCLFLPEYKLIISPCFSSNGTVDIHGFGAYPPYFTGVIHCVPSQAACADYEAKQVIPTGSAATFNMEDASRFGVHRFKLPYETMEREVRLYSWRIG